MTNRVVLCVAARNCFSVATRPQLQTDPWRDEDAGQDHAGGQGHGNHAREEGRFHVYRLFRFRRDPRLFEVDHDALTRMSFDADGNQVGVVFETASPFVTPRLMSELVDWFDQAQDGELHPLITIGTFVFVFLEIHPFQDGNGRLSRVLTTLLLLRAGYAYVPYSSLESVIEQSKEGYYLALRRTQGTIRTEVPDWTPWLTFFLTALQRQMRRLREKVERERLLLAKLPDLAIRILDHARDHGRVTIADAVAITGASRNTLKLHVKTLRERGLLALHGQLA